MEKIWLKNYPPGVPAEINPDEYSSLNELFDVAISRYQNRPAFANMGRTLTFIDMDRKADAFAAWLASRGLIKDDRIAIMLPNVLQYPIALIGALRAGLTIVNVNPLYTPHELEHQLSDSGAKAIVVLENFAHTLQKVIAKTALRTVIVTAVGDILHWPKSALVNFVLRRIRKQVPAYELPDAISFRTVLRAGGFLPPIRVALSHTDIAFLQYTGGTTGVAKGAMLSHRNMIANVVQSTLWIGDSGDNKLPQIAVAALPLYHIFSLTANTLAFVKRGALILLITNPRDFPGFVKELSRYRFTFISGVNTLFNALLNTPGFDRLDFSALDTTLGGGMAVQAAVAEHWKKVTGNVLTQAWGLTETSPGVCINPVQLQDFNGSIGLPISSTEVSVRDDDGRELAVGEVGELCVRGPQVMEGYWQRPDETAKVMLPDGWLRTGDIGRVDPEGFVYIEDRKKDMIVVSGFNVYPNEVESVIASHPGILEVAAVAEPDERSGEVVALFVVLKDPSLTEQAIIQHARTELTGYKVPKHIYFRKELPKTNVGKILRRELRDELRKKKA